MKESILLLLFVLTTLSLEANKNETTSKALGYLINKNIQSTSIQLDLEAFIEGLNSKNALEEPLEEEYLHAINTLQDFIAVEKKNVNLRLAEHFLSKNKNKPNVIEIVPKKIQYKTVYEGSGKKVTIENTPLIKYKVTTLDNEVICVTKEPQIVSLLDIATGFSKGLLGMKEKETRIIFLHPDYNFLKNSEFESNLLKIEVQLIKRHQSYTIDKSFISKQEYIR